VALLTALFAGAAFGEGRFYLKPVPGWRKTAVAAVLAELRAQGSILSLQDIYPLSLLLNLSQQAENQLLQTRYLVWQFQA